MIPVFKAWSFSSLDGFETCPKQHYHTHVAKDVPFKASPETLWGREVHVALDKRLKAGVPLPVGMEKWEPIAARFDAVRDKKILITETKLCVNSNLQPVSWFDKSAWCRGIIDVGALGKTRGVVADYKTGKRKPNSDQLKLFAALALHHYTNLEVIDTAFIWLKDDATDTATHTRAELADLWQVFLPRVQRMKIAYEQDKFLPNPSGLCKKYCPVPSTKCEFSGDQNG